MQTSIPPVFPLLLLLTRSVNGFARLMREKQRHVMDGTTCPKLGSGQEWVGFGSTNDSVASMAEGVAWFASPARQWWLSMRRVNPGAPSRGQRLLRQISAHLLGAAAFFGMTQPVAYQDIAALILSEGRSSLFLAAAPEGSTHAATLSYPDRPTDLDTAGLIVGSIDRQRALSVPMPDLPDMAAGHQEGYRATTTNKRLKGDLLMTDVIRRRKALEDQKNLRQDTSVFHLASLFAPTDETLLPRQEFAPVVWAGRTDVQVAAVDKSVRDPIDLPPAEATEIAYAPDRIKELEKPFDAVLAGPDPDANQAFSPAQVTSEQDQTILSRATPHDTDVEAVPAPPLPGKRPQAPKRKKVKTGSKPNEKVVSASFFSNTPTRLPKGEHAWLLNKLPKNSYTKRQRDCLAEAIYFEARGEAEKGQIAVAQVVINRVKNPAYPESICKVVYQNENWRNRCQFSFACDGIPERIRSQKSWKLALRIADDVISGKSYLKDIGSATHYHATYVKPRWRKRMRDRKRIGTHIFYRTKRGGWS